MDSSHTEVAVVEGDDLELVCTFFGRPRPVVGWSGPQDILPTISENFVSLSGGFQVMSVLNVSKVSLSDGGKYSCTGRISDYPDLLETRNFSVAVQSKFIADYQFDSSWNK